MENQTMKIGPVSGINWTEKQDDESRIFVTRFTLAEAQEAIRFMAEALTALELFISMDGAYAHRAAEQEKKLKKLAEENLDLFLYAVKAALEPDRYFGQNRAYRWKLPEYVADAVNRNPERQMPVFRHMLKIWPHTEYWCVPSNILSKAYRLIDFSKPECAADMQFMLRDSYKHPRAEVSNWLEALKVMMQRAKKFPEETVSQFAVMLRFLNIYGRTAAGYRGIIIPTNIYNEGGIDDTFKDQNTEMQELLCNMVNMEMYANPRKNIMLGGMKVTRPPESFFKAVEELKKTDPAAARQKMQNEFNAFANYDWSELTDAETVEWIGEILNGPLSTNAKQTLVYKLNHFRRDLVDNTGSEKVHAAAGKVLESYRPDVEDGEQGEVFAGCARMFAIASEKNYKELNSRELKGEMLKLIEMHAALGAYERRPLDGMYNDDGHDVNPYRVWPKLLFNFSLQKTISEAIVDRMRAVQLDDPGAVRELMKVIHATYAPGRNEKYMQYAIPHEEFAQTLKQVIGYDYQTQRVTRDNRYIHDIFSSLLDALETVLTQQTYSRYYFDIITSLALYCAALEPAQRARERTNKERLDRWAKDFHRG